MSQMEIDKSGTKIWRNSRGQCHREDGPALEFANGKKYWYINGIDYSFEFDEWLAKSQMSDEEKVMLCLKWK